MQPPDPRQEPPHGLLYRLAWFLGLWLAGVAVVAAVAYAIRWAIAP
jgi:cell division septal protein FtsQ